MEVLKALYSIFFSSQSAATGDEGTVSTAVVENRQAGLAGTGFGGLGIGGLVGPLSSFYQLNIGLVGIGALAVVAIIGSRNFFANYLYQKQHKYSDYSYGHHPPQDYTQGWWDWYNYYYGSGWGAATGAADPYKHYYDDNKHHKYKRSTRALKKKTSKSEEHLLMFIKKIDRSKCVNRLICELSRKKKDVTESEKHVLELIRHGDRRYNALYPGKGLTGRSASLKEYQMAADESLRSTNRSCADTYSGCPYSAQQLMTAVHKLEHLL